ncbi:MAG: hypothetical protein ACI9TV_001741 [Sulfurimonas sp.]|jgi:hypothetical protein|uniref:putative metalloprotease CJM1_0395 family protein n=1 Tax=Sulfurimonas sp. TaxID=2022749 RepID=UPI0039E4DD6E
MIIGSPSFANISSSYTIKLNEEESLEFKKEKVVDNPNELKKEEIKEIENKSSIKSSASKELSEGEEQLVKDLGTRDAEVRAHEAAHQSAGGGMTGAASFTYQQGPDGKMYAIGGEVSISMKGGSTPEETIANARQIASAAMAAAEPSSQDFAVASSARVMEMKAQQQLAKEQREETLGIETYSNSASDENTENKDNRSSVKPFNISA